MLPHLLLVAQANKAQSAQSRFPLLRSALMARQVATTQVKLMPGMSNMACSGVCPLLYILLTTVKLLKHFAACIVVDQPNTAAAG